MSADNTKKVEIKVEVNPKEKAEEKNDLVSFVIYLHCFCQVIRPLCMVVNFVVIYFFFVMDNDFYVTHKHLK